MKFIYESKLSVTVSNKEMEYNTYNLKQNVNATNFETRCNYYIYC